MHKSLETAEVAPTIVALQEHLETVRQNEFERVSRRKVSFGPEQLDAIEELSRGIVSRILHGPVKVLEAASDDEEPAALLSMVHRIFNLATNRQKGRVAVLAGTTEPLHN
jgi:glutamyl-tRNA reductase